MRYAQVLLYENDPLLTTMLEEKASREKWSLRHPRDFAECRDLLRRGGPAVLVLRVGRNLEFELSLLERVAALFPDVGTVVVGEAAHPPAPERGSKAPPPPAPLPEAERGRISLHPLSASGRGLGGGVSNCTRKRAPPSAFGSYVTVPPCSCTNLRVTNRPRPVPCFF